MAIETDFEVQGDGDIRAVGGTDNYTVLELHRWLQDLADDPAMGGDDFVDITTATPSERSTDNIITLNSPFNIDDATAQRLYDGSITQKGGDEIYAGLVVVGAVESGTQLQIWQDEAILTSHWGTGKNPDAAASILNRVLVKVRTNGADIDGRRIIVWSRELSDTYAEFSVTMGLGNNVAAIFTADDLNNQTAEATIATWSDIDNTEGYQLLDIAGDGSADEPYYSQWDKASRTPKQLYERTKWLSRRGTASTLHGRLGDLFRGITHQFDYDGQSTNFATNNIVAWGTSFNYDGGTGTVPAVGQYWRNTTTGGVGKVVWVSAGAGVTGTVMFQREAATPTWVDPGTLTLLGGTGTIDIDGVVTPPVSASLGGSAVILADKDDGTTGTLWLQLISGTIAGNNDPIWRRAGTTGKYADVNLSPTTRTVSPEYFGSFTGSSIIGAFGIGIDPADGIAADLFTTLANASVQPPNNQKFTVSGLVVGDRVLVCTNEAVTPPPAAPDFDQLTLQTDLTGAAETAVVVTTAIPADTPLTGTIRINLNSGRYKRVSYGSWTGSTFDISGSPAPERDFSGDPATAPKNVFITYIDKGAGDVFEEVTLKFSAERTMFVRVRDGGPTPIKTFETTSVFGTGGGAATANRISDT